MNYEFSPKAKLIGYTIGFVAGTYSLFLGAPIASDLFEFILLLVWFPLIGASIVVNVWGMLHQAELLQASDESGDKNE